MIAEFILVALAGLVTGLVIGFKVGVQSAAIALKQQANALTREELHELIDEGRDGR